jgi:hypothetical protein
VKNIFAAILMVALMATYSHAGTVTLGWNATADPNVTKANAYRAKGVSCATSTPQTPAVAPWTLVNSVLSPIITDSFTEWSGTTCYYVTFATATEESQPSNVVIGVVPLPIPVLSFK